MKKIEVVAAIFIKEKRVFCAQRANKGPLAKKWEFPGGKIELNESKEEALKREIMEELNCIIQIDDYLMTIEHQYETFYLTMHTYLCTPLSLHIQLVDHVDSKWLAKEELETVDWAEADLPIVSRLKEIL